MKKGEGDNLIQYFMQKVTRSGITPNLFFENVNFAGTKTSVECLMGAMLVFYGAMDTWGNHDDRFLDRINMPGSGEWIPGDWGYINSNIQNPHPGESGENVIYVGRLNGKLHWWGHNSGNTLLTEEEWKLRIKGWFDSKNPLLTGKPSWDPKVSYPMDGLETAEAKW